MMQPLQNKLGNVRSASAMVLLFVGVLLAAAVPALRADMITINFETEPSLPTQPNNFAAAGPMQTYTKPGVYTISGGVVLGNPTFLAAFATQGSLPNAYGTSDFADPSLLDTITLDFPAAETVVSVAGVLFNGQVIPENYQVLAFSGASQVASQSFTGMAASSSAAGFGKFMLSSTAANPITKVTVASPNSGTNGWDFFLDTVNLTTSVATFVPEPSTFVLAAFGGLIAVGRYWRRRRGDADLADSRGSDPY